MQTKQNIGHYYYTHYSNTTENNTPPTDDPAPGWKHPPACKSLSYTWPNWQPPIPTELDIMFKSLVIFIGILQQNLDTTEKTKIDTLWQYAVPNVLLPFAKNY